MWQRRTWSLFGRTTQHVAQATKETQRAEDEHEVRSGVKPAVEKEADQSADEDGRNENERQLHGDGKLTGKTGGPLFGRTEILAARVVIVRRHSEPAARTVQDTTRRRGTQTPQHQGQPLERYSFEGRAIPRLVCAATREPRRGNSSKERERCRVRRKRRARDDGSQ